MTIPIVHRLCQTDCEQLLALSADLYENAPDLRWRPLFFKRLRQLLAYDFAGCHIMNAPKAEVMQAFYEPAKPQVPLEHREFWRIIQKHPLTSLLFEHTGRSWCMNDQISRVGFRQTEVFEVLYRPVGVDSEMSAVIPLGGGSDSAVMLISLHRSGKDFTARDRCVLDLLLPHVGKVGRRACDRSEEVAQPELDCDAFSRRLKESSPWKLTSREAEVLYWLQQGKTNGEIGRILGISERTAETHALRSYPKIGVENRFGAIVALGHFIRNQQGRSQSDAG